MSKTRLVKKAGKTEPAISTALNNAKNHLLAVAGKRKGIITAAFVMAAIVLYFIDTTFSASAAALYLFADNGKKSGRADGNVFMRNGRVRGFKVPALVRNAYTAVARGNMAMFSSGWNTLSELQRAGWNSNEGYVTQNRFAQAIYVRGKALFIALNTYLVNCGQTMIEDAPILLGNAGFTDFTATVDVSANEVKVFFEPDPISTGYALLIFATAQLRAGVNRPSQSAYRLIDMLPAATISGENIFTNYTAKYGGLVAGSKIFFRGVLVDITTGQPSAPQDWHEIVVA